MKKEKNFSVSIHRQTNKKIHSARKGLTEKEKRKKSSAKMKRKVIIKRKIDMKRK